ncbi:MAG: DUF4347 domain-containing protein, partial [Planctomycetota bacterium]
MARLLRTEPPHVFDFYPLEDRILLSGEGIDGVDIGPAPDPALTEALLADFAPDGEALDLNQQTPGSSNVPNEHADALLIDPSEPLSLIDPLKPLEVVFIDANVDDAQTLIDGVRSQGDSETQWLIVELSGDQNGIEQISRTLNQLSGVDAIHLVSHGDGQGIQLGQTHLDLQTANAYAGQIANWGNALDSHGDLLVYGCDLARTEAGQDLLETLAALCDCDIAASDDVTGHSSLGGDWELEFVRGDIEAGVAFHSGAQQAWHGALATYTVTNTNDSGSGSLRQAILNANANSGQDTIEFNISTADSGYVDPDSIANSGDEYWTIGLTSFIGWITDSVIVDATTQLGYDPGTGRPVIELDGSAAAGATTVLGIDANNSTIRGFSIHSSSDEGIEIVGFSGKGQNNIIQGNWIGIDAEGNVDANAEHGIILAFAASNNTIGGSGTNEGNYIAGNGLSAVFLRDAGTEENVVIGNVIGILPDGSTAAANASHGITVGTSAANNVIGGTGASEGNTIAYSTLDGISVSSTAGSGNSILGNTIYNNTGLGIDLEGGTEDSNSVTANDTNDADTGPNDLQNFPVLSFAELNGTDLTVSGSIDTDSASTQYRIEFFGNTSGTQDSTHGEGGVYLGATTVTTNGSGDGSFTGVVLSGVTLNAGDFVTATATRVDDTGQVGVDDKLAYGSTSEFAANLSIAAGNVAPVGNNDSYAVNEDTALSVSPASSGVLANDTDGDSDPLTATLVSGPSNALSFQLFSDGTFNYQAVANFNGTDTFTYRANDGTVDSAITTVTVTVNAVNDTPVVSTNTGATVAEGSASNVITTAMLNEGDVDDSGAGLTYTITNVTDNGTIYLSGTGALGLNDTFTQADIDAGDITYDHDGSETSSDAFSFSLADGGENGVSPVTGTFNITVTPVNDNDPEITSNAGGPTASINTAENSTFVTTVTATDDDLPAETLTFSIIGGADAASFTINSSSGVLSFVSAPNAESPADVGMNNVYDVIVQVSDGSRVDSQSIAVSVTDVDEFDVGAVTDSDAATNAVDENAANGTVVGVTALASDADATNDTITYTLDNDAGGRFTINSGTGVVTVADGTLLDREAAASHDITVRATSSDGSFSTATMTIALNDVDEFDVGTVTDSDATTNAVDENAANGTVVGVTALASDADATNNTIMYTLDDDDGGRFTINSSTGVVTVADGTLLDREAAASHDITVRATSSDGSFNTATITIALNDVDEFDVGTVTD